MTVKIRRVTCSRKSSRTRGTSIKQQSNLSYEAKKPQWYPVTPTKRFKNPPRWRLNNLKLFFSFRRRFGSLLLPLKLPTNGGASHILGIARPAFALLYYFCKPRSHQANQSALRASRVQFSVVAAEFAEFSSDPSSRKAKPI